MTQGAPGPGGSKAREDRWTLPTYAKLPIVIVKGEGHEVIDESGRRYLDLYGGHAVTIAGHCHPRLVEAIEGQARELVFYSNVCYHPVRARAAELLLSRCYPGWMHQAYFCNSGTEANETALKIARRYTGRPRVIAMQGGFHGRTIGSLSVTGIDAYREAMVPSLSGETTFVLFGDLRALEAVDGSDVAAVILEPIQSMAGVRVGSPEYYHGLRSYCDRKGAVLVFDEVQTGMGRTGRWFAGEHWGVVPDVVTMAKGIAGGFPMGAVVVNEAIASTIRTGDHGATFGGGPLAAAAMCATFEIIEEEGLVANAERIGARFREELPRIPVVREVRGLGLLIGFECERPAREVRDALLGRGIIIGTSTDSRTLRLLPGLSIGEDAVGRLVEALKEV